LTAFVSFARRVGLALLLASAAAPVQAADIAWLMSNCESGKLCPWWQVKLTPPPSWRIDAAFGKARKTSALILKDNATDDPVIYVNTSYGKETVDARIARSEEHWRERQPDVRIERLDDVARASGETPFRVYRYRNPSHANQPLEYLAWADHTDAKGNHFVFMAVLTNASEKVIEREKAAFLQVLKRL
jgi:hypothetical protein